MNANFLKIIICLSAFLSLVSCSNNDELLLEPKAQNRDVISFNVTSDRPTRSTLLNSKEDITKFMVSALVRTPGNSNYREYFSKDYVENQKDKWTNVDGERYWPNNGETLDFYAWTTSSNNMNYSNSISGKSSTTYGSYNINYGSPKLSNINQKSEGEMHDLCYATLLSCEKNIVSHSVSLNFKHAFAQIDIKAKVINPSLKVDIAGVSLFNLTSSGNLLFPTSSNEKCEWQIFNDSPYFCSADIGATILNPISISMIKSEDENKFISQEVNLTSNFSTGKYNPFIIIPFNHYISITPEAIKKLSKGEYTNKETTIRVYCRVWNISDTEKGFQNSDLQVFGVKGKDGGYACIYIPVALNTEPGKKYTYTITFGKGNAGYDANGNPSIVKVDWSVESKDWTEGLPEPQPISM